MNGGVNIGDESLEAVSGGVYDSRIHNLEEVSTNGTEIIYFGKDTCPICGKTSETYFYQNGSGFSCYFCGFGRNYK